MASDEDPEEVQSRHSNAARMGIENGNFDIFVIVLNPQLTVLPASQEEPVTITSTFHIASAEVLGDNVVDNITVAFREYVVSHISSSGRKPSR